MIRLCVDLNVWCSANLSRSHGRSGTAAQTIVDKVKRGACDRGALALVDILTTADLRGFVGADAEVVVPGRVYRLRRADRQLIVAHPFETAAWLRGETVFEIGGI